MNPGSPAPENRLFNYRTYTLMVGFGILAFEMKCIPTRAPQGQLEADLLDRNMEKKQARGLAMELRVADRW